MNKYPTIDTFLALDEKPQKRFKRERPVSPTDSVDCSKDIHLLAIKTWSDELIDSKYC